MTAETGFALSILQSLGFAVLRRVAERQYAFFGEPPAFYNEIFPAAGTGPCTAPWRYSPMLELFIDDAEWFFKEKRPGVISSGVWQEDGKTEDNLALLAVASRFNGEEAIIIRMLQDEYADRVGILRKARQQLLENRTLANSLEVFREKSRFDGLTKIYNRATFMELLHDEIKRSLTLGYPLSMLFLDIDDFKKINDTYGHPTGDVVLRNLGTILTNTLRRNDIIARYGGEEFVVLIPHESYERAVKIGEKIRRNIVSFSGDGIPPFRVSIGCTAYEPTESLESFIKRADMALYDAKTSGKNKVCVRRALDPSEPPRTAKLL